MILRAEGDFTMSIATKVPWPTRRCRYPSASSWLYAASAVTRETPKSPARTRDEGNRCPRLSVPL